jgi:hypothetical protein
MYAMVPYHSGTQRNRIERLGRGRRPESMSCFSVRAMSSSAADPEALSLADSLGWSRWAENTSSSSGRSAPSM